MALFPAAASGICHRAAGTVDGHVILVPVGGPLPDIDRRVEETVTVCGKGGDRRCPLVTVFAKVLPGELTLPCVRQMSAVGHQVIAPDELGSFEAAARRKELEAR